MATLLRERKIRKNPTLVPGVHRFGRSKMYHKRGLFVKTKMAEPKKVKEKKPLFVVKPIGGNGKSNGEERKIMLKKSKKYHPTAVCPKRRRRVGIKNTGKPKLRGSLKPGTVLILVAGRHTGKRVVFLKQLQSGLLLITGPFKLNGVPLRRINQQYVIATSTRLDISKLTIGENLNDTFFRRDKKAARIIRQKQRGDIFAGAQGGYELTDARKIAQEQVDKQILDVVKANEEKKLLLKYLASSFSLKSGQYPHRMKF